MSTLFSFGSSIMYVTREGDAVPKYGKRDANHQEIKEAAELMGAVVIDTAGAGQTCPGFPDMMWIVSKPYHPALGWQARGETWYIEVKSGDAATLTPAEEDMRDKVRAAGAVYHVVRTVEDVARLLGR